ncbi:Endonuclease-reverse transcriptase [Popillia japonica]|uniref:Endonuclease-reverse transcriptase n=1 Tax=Popillia japonica TaxID=7064 RepID=A0AAW1I9I6_POPJA
MRTDIREALGSEGGFDGLGSILDKKWPEDMYTRTREASTSHGELNLEGDLALVLDPARATEDKAMENIMKMHPDLRAVVEKCDGQLDYMVKTIATRTRNLETTERTIVIYILPLKIDADGINDMEEAYDMIDADGINDMEEAYDMVRRLRMCMDRYGGSLRHGEEVKDVYGHPPNRQDKYENSKGGPNARGGRRRTKGRYPQAGHHQKHRQRGEDCKPSGDLGRGRIAHDIAYAVAFDNSIDIIIIGEPNIKIAKENQYILDNKTNVAIYVKNKDIGICSHSLGEGFVCLKWEHWRLIGCYVSPNISLAEYDKHLDNLAEEIKSEDTEVVIAGDFNAKSPVWGSAVTDTRGEHLTEWAAELGLNVINKGDTPTFQRGASRSFIDITWASEKNNKTRGVTDCSGVQTNMPDKRYGETLGALGQGKTRGGAGGSESNFGQAVRFPEEAIHGSRGGSGGTSRQKFE